jgi:hypothetical protein
LALRSGFVGDIASGEGLGGLAWEAIIMSLFDEHKSVKIGLQISCGVYTEMSEKITAWKDP